MRGQIKTGTTMLDNIKEYLKNFGAFLFGSDDMVEEGYSDYNDIPDPTIENYPDEGKFINDAKRITSQLEGKNARSKIIKTSRNSIEENEKVSKVASERRKSIKVKVNESDSEKRNNIEMKVNEKNYEKEI